MWRSTRNLERTADRAFFDRIVAIFEQKGAAIYYVAFEADQSERLRRNATEFRLSQKPSKRNVAQSNERLMTHDEQHRFNSNDDFIDSEKHVKINNTGLSAEEVAQQVIERFGLGKIAQK